MQRFIAKDTHSEATVDRFDRRAEVLEWLTLVGDVADFQDNLRDAAAADSVTGRIVPALKNGGIIALAALGGVPRKALKLAVKDAEKAAPDIVRKMDSKPAVLYDPPTVPQRDFALDYPDGVESDALGRPLKDIDGRPLGGGIIAGRSTVGAGDTGIPEEVYVSLGEAGTGQRPKVVPKAQMPGASGQYHPQFVHRGGTRKRRPGR